KVPRSCRRNRVLPLVRSFGSKEPEGGVKIENRRRNRTWSDVWILTISAQDTTFLVSKRHRQLVAPACVGTPGWVVGWDDDARSPPLYRLSVSGRDHQPCHMALFPLPAWSPHGGGVARCPRHHRQPRNRAAVGAQIRPAVRQSDPSSPSSGWRQVASG